MIRQTLQLNIMGPRIRRGVGVESCFRFPQNIVRTLPTDAFHLLFQPAEGPVSVFLLSPPSRARGESEKNKKSYFQVRKTFKKYIQEM